MRFGRSVWLDCNERFKVQKPGWVMSGVEGSIFFDAQAIDAARSLRDALTEAIERLELAAEAEACAIEEVPDA